MLKVSCINDTCYGHHMASLSSWLSEHSIQVDQYPEPVHVIHPHISPIAHLVEHPTTLKTTSSWHYSRQSSLPLHLLLQQLYHTPRTLLLCCLFPIHPADLS